MTSNVTITDHKATLGHKLNLKINISFFILNDVMKTVDRAKKHEVLV